LFVEFLMTLSNSDPAHIVSSLVAEYKERQAMTPSVEDEVVLHDPMNLFMGPLTFRKVNGEWITVPDDRF